MRKGDHIILVNIPKIDEYFSVNIRQQDFILNDVYICNSVTVYKERVGISLLHIKSNNNLSMSLESFNKNFMTLRDLNLQSLGI